MFRGPAPASALLGFGLLLAAGCQGANGGHGSQPSHALTVSTPSHAHTNRLAREPSPYLRQHQHNPVDWFPWGEAAFARARAESRPIFLSIGYSTCHWCHVMERESFEDEAVARFLNTHFVSIKVDREERPDVDKIYMTFVQATTGGGGWPLNVFLTPDLKPFYGGTYFPPRGRQGHPGFLDLLEQVQRTWAERRTDITQAADDIQGRLAAHVTQIPTEGAVLGPSTLARAATVLKADYDPVHGGFGGAPKFPRPSHPAFLLRWARRSGDVEAQRMVLHTCERMAAGGLHDQLGGGFARYAVDAEWRVPHFEKMLYDNAQLVHLYLDAYLVSRETRHAQVARGVLGYVLRDMTHPDGGFYSAEDADSEGKEGKFYCWTRAEMAGLLTPEEFVVATRCFGVTEAGNFVDHSDPSPLRGQNVLHLAHPPRESAEAAWFEAASRKLFEARAKRVRPHLDDKVLASWNGLMLGALARSGVVLEEPRYLEAARRNLRFLESRLWDDSTGTLYHRWREGERDTVQLLDAYAFLLSGVIELYEATLNAETLAFARRLADSMLRRFYDAEHGGFWQSSAEAKDLILRVKEDYDGAEPSGNSVAILALLKLADITDHRPFRDAAERSLRFFGERLERLPQAVPYLLGALDYWLGDARRVVIASGDGDEAARGLVHAAHDVFAPNQVVLGTQGPVDRFARTLPAPDGVPTAYVCTGNACLPPTSQTDRLRELLK